MRNGLFFGGLIGLVAGAVWMAGCQQQTAPSKSKASDSATQTASTGTATTAADESSLPPLPPGHPALDGTPAAPAQPDSSVNSTLPPGHPPIGEMPQTNAAANPAAAMPSGQSSNDSIQFDVPADWVSRPLTSPMRTADYVLPRAEGDSEDGELIVYYFGQGQGGSVEANLARWRGMFTTSDGKPLPADAGKRETFEANGHKVTVLDIAGRYAPAAMPGMGAKSPHDDFRMVAAVVETPSGPYFFKATGPAATMEAQSKAILAALKSAHQ